MCPASPVNGWAVFSGRAGRGSSLATTGSSTARKRVALAVVGQGLDGQLEHVVANKGIGLPVGHSAVRVERGAAGDVDEQPLRVGVTAEGRDEVEVAGQAWISRGIEGHARTGGEAGQAHARAVDLRSGGERQHGIGEVARFRGRDAQIAQRARVRHTDHYTGARDSGGNVDDPRVVNRRGMNAQLEHDCWQP